jgi:hypothetical protein
MCLPQSQNITGKIIYIVGNPDLYKWSAGRCDSSPGPIMCPGWPSTSLSHVWCMVRLPLLSHLVGMVAYLKWALSTVSSVPRIAVTWTWVSLIVLTHHHHFHYQLPFHKNPMRESKLISWLFSWAVMLPTFFRLISWLSRVVSQLSFEHPPRMFPRSHGSARPTWLTRNIWSEWTRAW